MILIGGYVINVLMLKHFESFSSTEWYLLPLSSNAGQIIDCKTFMEIGKSVVAKEQLVCQGFQPRDGLPTS